jgi:hypothetical protein
MIALIPLINNDYLLVIAYIMIVMVAFYFKYQQGDYVFLVTGVALMFLFETVFIATGVETFERVSLLGIMPIWLPVLWGYGFVAIRRASHILRNVHF